MMKNMAAALLSLLMLTGTAFSARGEADMNGTERLMENPRDIRNIGDPFILHENGRYYLFATGGPAGFMVWQSGDLIHFERGRAMKKVEWASGDYWAPEVYPWKGRYVMLFTARWKENASLRIGAAVADRAEGPYEDLIGGPLFDFGYAAIDGTLVTDGAGTPYLIFSRDCSENVYEGRHESHLYGVQLAEDLLSAAGEPVLLTQPDQPWETLSGDWRWNEGPSVIRHEGKYYLFYSANYYGSKDYGVGAAAASSPLGPYKKQENNPILRWVGTDDNVLISGPGHNAFFTVGGELFASYHTHTFPDRPSGNRRPRIDRAGFHADGTAYINGPTQAPQLRPLTDIGCVNWLEKAHCKGDPANLLRDGDTCQAASSSAYAWQGGTARFSFDEPVPADTLMLYPAAGKRITGTAEIGSQQYSFDFTPEVPGESCLLALHESNIMMLKIELKQGALGEIMLIGLSGDSQ